MRTGRIHFQQFVKERPVVDYCLTHFFRVCFTLLTSQRQRARCAVVLDDHRMIDGEVISPPIEVGERVAARRHHLRHELIGFTHGTAGVIDEARLNAAPFACECLGLIGAELAQVEAADAVGPLPQNGFGTCRTDGLNCSFVFRTEALAQIHTSASARVCPEGKPEQHNHDSDTDEHEGF